MSGGHFDYQQGYIEAIADEIEDLIELNDIPTADSFGVISPRNYSERTINEFQNALQALRVAYVYAQRIDWLVSGDDGEDTFHERLAEELEEVLDV